MTVILGWSVVERNSDLGVVATDDGCVEVVDLRYGSTIIRLTPGHATALGGRLVARSAQVRAGGVAPPQLAH